MKLTTLKNSFINTFTGVANEKEIGIVFLTVGLPLIILVLALSKHVTL